ncbi:hypothetical protein A2U01_0104961, partial [Trifolium medium]|nr:hypothetical protein [Trifolium medium]
KARPPRCWLAMPSQTSSNTVIVSLHAKHFRWTVEGTAPNEDSVGPPMMQW